MTELKPLTELYGVEKIQAFKQLLEQVPEKSIPNEKWEIGLGCQYKHVFTPGIYIRQMFIPKGIYIVSEIHKTEHPFFILTGAVSVYSPEGGLQRFLAPFMGVTKPGTQRALFTHEDTLWITIHATEKTDINEIGKEILEDTRAIESQPKGAIE